MQWNTKWRDAAHSNSEDSIWLEETRKEKHIKTKPDLAVERPERARAGFRLH